MLKEKLKELNFNFVPSKEVFFRIKKFQEILQYKNCDVAILLSRINNYYFTGTNQEQITLIFADKDPIILVKRDLGRVRLESPLESDLIKNFKDIKKYLDNASKIGLEFDYISAKEFLKFKNILNTEFFDITKDIKNIRSVKSEWEISIIKKAGLIAEKVYLEGANYLKEGISEIEFGAILFDIALKNGHEGILRTSNRSFEVVSWHILSGISGCIHGQYDSPASGFGLSPAFPNSASRKKIFKNEPIMVDFGICIMGYQVDTTRMYCIGEPKEKMLEFFSYSTKIKAQVEKNLLPGNTGDECYNKAISEAKKLNCYNEFLGLFSYKKKFVGHGVGLEISELPLIAEGFKDEIKANMVIAIEPKLVIEELGIIGIENTYCIKKNSIENLTPFAQEIIIV